jgi:hypothetical protein
VTASVPAPNDRRTEPRPAVERPVTLVWIDSREAIVVHWVGGEARVERLESEVPVHHRSTGHVRHDPGIRSGGGGPSQTAGEPHRLEHLERFLETVLERLPDADELLVVGPGTVHEHLAAQVRQRDERHRRERPIVTEAAAPMTRRQLIAWARRAAGAAPRRRTSGPHPSRMIRAVQATVSGGRMPAAGRTAPGTAHSALIRARPPD